MSKKKHEDKRVEQPVIKVQPKVEQEAVRHIPNQPLKQFQKRGIAKHLRCPLCFNGLGGTGKQIAWTRVSGLSTKIKYGCNQCGHSWSVIKKVVSIVLEQTSIEVEEETDD